MSSGGSYLLEPAALHWAEGAPQSEHYGDVYWYKGQALPEKRHVFLNQLRDAIGDEPLTGKRVTCGELGFGFGVNFLLAADYWRRDQAGARLDYIAIEGHPVTRADLERVLSDLPLPGKQELLAQWPTPFRGTHVIWLADNIRLLLILDDVASALPNLLAPNGGAIDVWYLDGFAPARNEAMWRERVFRWMFARSNPGARVTTYSVAAQVRSGLAAAGFQVERVPGFGAREHMTVARKPGEWQPASQPSPRVGIVGGGLAGHFCAEALGRRGIDATILDKGGPAPSHIPQLSVMPLVAVHPEAKYRYSLLALAHMGSAPGFTQCGVEFISRTAEEAARHERIAGQFPDDVIEWQGDRLVFKNGGAWSLADYTEVTRQPVTAADIVRMECDGEVRLFAASGEQFDFDAVILATGHEPSLVGSELELRGVRGQAITVPAEEQDDSCDKSASVLTGSVTVFPSRQGRRTISGTYQRSRDVSSSAQDTATLLRAAREVIDLPEDPHIETHVGIRGASRDRMPIVDALPDRQGVYVCTAFGSRGATHARLAAEYLAGKILGEASALVAPQARMLSVARLFRKKAS